MFGPDENGQVIFLDRKLIHGAPITDMSSHKQNLVSCDESGCTVLSKFDCGELMIIARSKIFGGLVKYSERIGRSTNKIIQITQHKITFAMQTYLVLT